MRIVLVHPNYHSGGAEIAGSWPPAWVAYLAGHLKDAGYSDVHFIDAMTNDLSDQAVAEKLVELKPDVVGCTAITPSIYKAEQVLKVALDHCPDAVRVLGGVHATFMYKQVLTEAPWIDVIVRGEGEEIFLNLIRAIDEGRFPVDRDKINGLAYRDGEKIIATQAAPTVQGSGMPSTLTGACLNGRNTLTCRWEYVSLFQIWRAVARLPAHSAVSGNSGAIIGSGIPLKSWMK